MANETPLKETSSRFRRLRGLGVFLLGLIAFDSLILAYQETWEQHSPDDYAERVRGCDRQQRDIVFVGGSTVAEGIDPARIVGTTWRGEPLNDGYAVGLSGGTTSDIYFAVRRACKQAPRLLIYGITASDINDTRHEPHGPHSLMDWRDVRDWRETRPDAAEWVSRHYLRGRISDLWSAYRFRHGIRMWSAMQADRIAPGCCPETLTEARRFADMASNLRSGNGYVPTGYFASRAYSTMKAGGWVAPPFEYLARYRTGSHLRYLHRLIDWAEEHGTTLLLVEMPTTADLESRHPKEIAEFRQRLTEVARQRTVAILHGNRERTGLDDRHFADLIHLNQDGAKVFSDWLRNELAKHETPASGVPVEASGVVRAEGRR